VKALCGAWSQIFLIETIFGPSALSNREIVVKRQVRIWVIIVFTYWKYREFNTTFSSIPTIPK